MRKQAEETIAKSVRYPIKLWEELAKFAEYNGRTISGEIIFRLRKSLPRK